MNQTKLISRQFDSHADASSPVESSQAEELSKKTYTSISVILRRIIASDEEQREEFR